MTGESPAGGSGPLRPGQERDLGTRSVVLLRAALAAVAFAVVTEAVLGAAGALGAALPVVTVGWLAGAILWARAGAGRRQSSGSPSGIGSDVARRPWTASEVLAVAAVGVALVARAWEGLHRGAFTYDVLSYHLHLPATWRAAGRLSIVPTPFGDQAPAYAPANAELLYQLLLSASGNVRLAHAGQAPFAALACLAIFAGTRTLRAGRTVAAGSALAFLLVPEVWQQAGGAMTDLAAAAFFLAALPFLVRCGSASAPADVVGGALALGLLLGTKYVGAILAVPLVTWALVLVLRGAWNMWRQSTKSGPGGMRARAMAVALSPLLVFAVGGFWYVRNAAVTGDPMFPVTLEVPTPFGSWTLARGLYGRTAMEAWTYHLPVTHLQPLLEIVSEIGWGFLGGTAIGAIALCARRRLGWPALWAVSIALAWLVVPYQQSRFFFGAWGVAALMMGASTTRIGEARPLWPVAIAVVGSAVQFPTAARILAAGAFALAALIPARQAPNSLHAGPSRIRALAWLQARARRGRAWGLAGLAGATVTVVVAIRAFPGEVAYAIGDHHDAGWDFARQHLHGRRIAYAGSNLPLPLWGWRLDNEVRYVNVRGGPHERLLERAPRETVTLPSAEPAPERVAPDPAAWLRNLAHHRIDTLFVTALYPAVADGMPHDGEGFPTERAWADARPEQFTLRFAAPGVRVYDVQAGDPSGGPARTEGR